VRLYTKYRSAPARKSSSSHFQWLLLAMLVAFLIWVWWKNLQHATRVLTGDQDGRVNVTPVLHATRNGATNPAATLIIARSSAPGLRDSAAPGPHLPKNAYELQIALARQGISVGSLDGVMGSQTRSALRAFQQRDHLAITGEADSVTKNHLLMKSPP